MLHRNIIGVNKAEIEVFSPAIAFSLNMISVYLKNKDTTKAQTILNNVLQKL